MSRHRNVRNMRYEDELSNDEYGVSYDDLKNYAVSPDTEEMFTYNRVNSKEPTLSYFMEEPSLNDQDDQDELDEGNDNQCVSSSDYQMPELDDANQAKLQNGLESLEGILGENCHQRTAVTALMKFNYDVEKALDEILSKGGRQTLSLEPQSSTKSRDPLEISQFITSVVPIGSAVDSGSIRSNIKAKIPRNGEYASLSDLAVTVTQIDQTLNALSGPVLRSLVPKEQSHSKDLSNLMKSPLSAIGTTTSTQQCQSDSLMRQPLSSLMTNEPSQSKDLFKLMKSPLSAIGTTISTEQCQIDTLLRQPLSSSMANEPRQSKDVSSLLKSPLGSIVTVTSAQQCQNDTLLRQPLSSLMAPCQSKDVSSRLKSPLGSIGTTISTEQCQIDTLLRQPLSSLMANEPCQSKDVSSLLKSPLGSIVTVTSTQQCQNDTLLRQPLSSLMANEPCQSKDISSLLKSPLGSIGTVTSTQQCQNDTLLRQPLSSLMANESSQSKDFSKLMMAPLSSLGTTTSTQQCQNDTLMKQPLSSLIANESSQSKDLSKLMKSPHSSIGTTTSTQQCQNDTLMNQPLSALLTNKPMNANRSDTAMKFSLNSISDSLISAQPGKSKGDLSAYPQLRDSLLPNHNDISARMLMAIGLQRASSQKEPGLFSTPARSSALSELSVASRDEPSNKLGIPTLSELAKNDRTFDSYDLLKRTEKGGRRNMVDKSNLITCKDGRTDIGKTKEILDHTSSLMKRKEDSCTHERSDLLLVKDMRTSLKELSLENSLRSFANRTTNAASSDLSNTRLHENGRDIVPSRKHLEYPLRVSMEQSGNDSISSDMYDRLQDVVMKNQSDRVENSILTIRNRVRKRRASSFGQAISSLHEHRTKIPRKDPFYENTHGFSLPVTVDLRGLPHVDDTRKLNVFNFSTRSQDDVVMLKQKYAFSAKTRQKPSP